MVHKKIYRLATFCIFILAFDCENNELNNNTNSIHEIQNRFSLENFDDQFVKDNLTIDWDNYKVNINEETLEEHYEFDTHLKSENYIENDKQKLSFVYKLLAFKNEQNIW